MKPETRWSVPMALELIEDEIREAARASYKAAETDGISAIERAFREGRANGLALAANTVEHHRLSGLTAEASDEK